MKHVLLIHGGTLGDFVMSLGVVSALRRAGAEGVAVLGRPLVMDVAPLAPDVDAAWDIEQSGFHRLFAAEGELPPQVVERLRPFDTVVNMLGGTSCTTGSAAGALHRQLARIGVERVIDIDPRPRPGWSGHITEQWLLDLRASGIETQAGPPRLHVDEAQTRAARMQLDRFVLDLQCGRGSTDAEPGSVNPVRMDASGAPANQANTGPFGCHIAVLHPGSGSRKKCWPPANYTELAGRLQAAGRRCAFMLGPVEQECWPADEVAKLKAVAPLVSGCRLAEAAALIAAGGVFVGNDSGMSHLAAALGVRTVAVFGPTDPVLWRPLGERVTLVRGGHRDTWPSVDEVFRLAPSEM